MREIKAIIQPCGEGAGDHSQSRAHRRRAGRGGHVIETSPEVESESAP